MSAKKRNSKKIGQPPGTLTFTGDKKVNQTDCTVVKFNAQKYLQNNDIANIIVEPDFVTWYDVRGLHEIQTIKELGSRLSLHALVLEDIVDPYQRPKFEEYEQGVFLVFKAVSFNKALCNIQTEQVSIFAGQHFVLTFQEDADDLFANIRSRITDDSNRIRKRGSDFLFYALIDYIVDYYYLCLDSMEEYVEEIDIAIQKNNQQSILKNKLHAVKNQMITMRKAINPLREAIGRLSRSEHPFITSSTKIYIRDLYDHTIQIMDSNETLRDNVNSLQDLYISEISYRMNGVIQVLTIISTIFIPLTFLVGVYGMNFDVMPELHWDYGYFALWLLMLLILIGQIFYFKRKKWL